MAGAETASPADRIGEGHSLPTERPRAWPLALV